MIEKLEETIKDYEEELKGLTTKEINEKEDKCFTINGNRLNEIAGIINEKIKISDTFTRYIIERCAPNQINTLRNLVENYERQVELFKEGLITDIESLKMTTVSINLLFGMDVSYYSTLQTMYSKSIVNNIYNYFSECIDKELNYIDLQEIIHGKGFDKDVIDRGPSKTR